MKRFFARYGWLAGWLVAFATGAAQFKFPTQTMTVPDGFVVEVAATTELVPRPISASFDDQGHLYVTDSSGSNEKPEVQLKNPTHRIVRLDDTDGDGKFDQRTVFADKVMFPEGCLWHDGAVYVAAPPSIWKFTDTDGDGVADKREEWFQGKTLTGCANDLHGPYLGPEGYIYWTKGAFAEQTHKLGNGRILKDRASHIYRARPDGSDLDVIMTGGMDNPVEVAFTPEGETLFTSTFIDFSQPGFRDGIGHAAYGATFGKINDVIEPGEVKRASPELVHPFYQAGPSAESGLCRYEDDAFGPGFRDNFFATTFNLHKVTRHILRPEGATYASTNSDFLVSDSVDFHPTDVLPDADGSLLVLDTGGWYKLCCPSSQLAKPDVLGAIYRVKKLGAKSPAKSERAAAYRRLTAPPSLAESSMAVKVKRAAWNPGTQSPGWFVEVLKKNTPAATAESAHIARAAAEGIGRSRERAAVPALLAAAAVVNDLTLETSLVQALMDIADPTATRAGLKHPRPRAQRAALIALDQMDGGNLQPAEVTPFLTSSDAELRHVAAWVAGHHPDWGGALAGFFREQLNGRNLSDADRAELGRQLAQFASDASIESLMGSLLGSADSGDSTKQAVLDAVVLANLKSPPAAWCSSVVAILAAKPAGLLPAAIAAARVLAPTKNNEAQFSTPLQGIGADEAQPVELRLEALAALPGGLKSVDAGTLTFLRANLDPAKPVIVRNLAASVLARSRFTEEQLLALTDTLQATGPLEVTRLLSAFEQTHSETVGLKLMAALRESKGLTGVRQDALQALVAKYPASVQAKANELLALLNVDEAKQKAHLDALISSLPKGDIRAGQAVFNSQKAACSTCHRTGYIGGNVGPDLTSIGQARTERDLLESIVYPSASFVRSYEPVSVTTKSDEEFSGVLRKDSADEVVLATGINAEARIPRADITEMRPSRVSVMPGGLESQLSKQELADLIAFLKSTK